MPQIKLVTNVSDYGLFRGLARSRSRLIVSTLVATAVALGLGLWSAHYVLEQSASVVLNLLIITANMMVMLVAAYLQTVLVGDLFFSGPWREQVILGETPTEGSSVADHNAEFMIVLILLVVANAMVINFGAGGFLDRYHNEGFFEVRLRSEDAAERRAAFEEMADPMNYELWENEAVRQLVIDHLDDPAEEVRAAAIWNAGELDIEQARDELVAIVTSDASSSIRAEAAQALGKLGNDTTAREALETLLTREQNRDVLIGALRGLALMKSPLSVEAAMPLIDAEDPDVMLHAYWVLRNSGEPTLRPRLREKLTAELEPLEHCAVLDTLKMVATPEDVNWARRQFARVDPEQGCDPVIWEDRDETQYYVLYSDSFREKYLKIVANAAGAENLAWFQRLVNDPSQTWRIREVANEVVTRLKKAQGGS